MTVVATTLVLTQSTRKIGYSRARVN